MRKCGVASGPWRRTSQPRSRHPSSRCRRRSLDGARPRARRDPPRPVPVPLGNLPWRGPGLERADRRAGGSRSCSTGAWSRERRSIKGGRAAAAVAFRAAAGQVLVADIGATSHRRRAHRPSRAASSLTTTEPADVADGPEVILGRVEALFAQVRETSHWGPAPVWGIGIAVPGPVEFETGRPISPPIMPGWNDYPIRERFAEGFGAPVWVHNDVNVLALGEWRSGIAQGHDNVVVIKIGTGIGAGIYSGRAAASRRPGLGRGRGAHPGRRRPVRRVQVRQHRLPRGARRRVRARDPGRGAAAVGGRSSVSRRRWTSGAR